MMFLSVQVGSAFLQLMDRLSDLILRARFRERALALESKLLKGKSFPPAWRLRHRWPLWIGRRTRRLSQLPTCLPEYHLAAPVGHEHHMILAAPLGKG